ncbi:MAG: preprotein translocase subunit SecE [Proteobacteria bacterium]|nr:preprotein translocase subunit SecE [Pseudomonadota bacterium]
MNKDDSYWLKLAYAAFAVLVAFTMYKAFGTLGVQTGWSDRYDEWYQPASTFGSFVVAGLVTWYLAADKARHEYFLAVLGELRKVNWPSMLDTRKMTLIVCVVVGVFAVILAIFDFIWAKIFGLLIA